MGKIFGNIWEEDEDKKEETVGAVRVTQADTGVETLRQRAGRGDSIFGDIWKDVPDRDYSQPAEPVKVQETKTEEKKDGIIVKAAKGYSDVAQDTVQITGAGLAVGTERVLTGAGNVALRGIRATVPRLGQGFFKVVGAVTPDNGYFSNLGDKFYRDMSGTYDKWVGASEQIKQKGAEVSGKVADFYMDGVEVGGSTYEEYMQQRQEGFKGADFTDPRFWAFEAYKTTVENAPLMALTYGVGSKFQVFNAATKTGKVANFLAATFGSTAFSTGMNASIEAQSAYSDALKNGKDEKQALLEAERVFNRNFGANMFYETIQNGMVFYGNPAGAAVAPLWKTAAKYATKVGVGGFTEAMQERGEDAIQNQAGNDKFNWGQAIKEVGKLQVTKTDVVSFIMGAGFQMVGSAAEQKNNKVMRDIENSQAFPIQESIAAGDVNAADVFQNGKDGILTRKFAQGRIDDVAQKLAAVDPKLEGEFRANIDADKTTMGQITTLGMSLLENATKTTTDVNASGGTIVDLEVSKQEYASQVQELANALWQGEDAPPTGAAAEQFIYEQIENNPDGVRDAYSSIVANRTNFAEQAKQAAAATVPADEVQTVDLNVTDSSARIEIKKYGDQFAARFITDLGETGAQTEFDLDNLAGTPDAARQIALDSIVEWVENQQANGNFSPVTQSRLEELANRSRESRGEQKLPEPKKEPEPAPQQPEPAPIATSENVNKTQFVVNVGNDPTGQRQGSEMVFNTLEEAQAFTQEVQEKTGEFLNIEERKQKTEQPKNVPKTTGKGSDLLGATVTYRGKEYRVTGGTTDANLIKITREGETAQFVDAGTVEVIKQPEKKKVLPSSKKKTQKEQVKDVLAEKEEATIQDIADITGILEPNVRRILGVGAKDGTFERVDTGVYRLNVNGKEIAYVMAADAVETLPKLAKQGFKADMVFLDIPYETKAVKGGNRGVNYNFISVDDFDTVVKAIDQIVANEDTPVIHMYSQAESGMKEMTAYNDTFPANGFVPIAKGEWQKTYKDGSPVAFPTRNGSMVTKPEGILVFNKSGKVPEALGDLQFKTVRPKGYQTEKPEEMLKAMIEMTTNEGDVVLDPFAGSGVTGAAAVKTGRRSVSIEKDAGVVENITKPRIEAAVLARLKKKKGNWTIPDPVETVHGTLFQPPAYNRDAKTSSAAARQDKELNQALLDHALEIANKIDNRRGEGRLRMDSGQAVVFKGMDVNNMSPADQDSLNMFLFGVTELRFSYENMKAFEQPAKKSVLPTSKKTARIAELMHKDAFAADDTWGETEGMGEELTEAEAEELKALAKEVDGSFQFGESEGGEFEFSKGITPEKAANILQKLVAGYADVNKADYALEIVDGGKVRMYHGTSKANATSILANGFEEGKAYFSSTPDKLAGGVGGAAEYGDTIIEVTVEANKVSLNGLGELFVLFDNTDGKVFDTVKLWTNQQSAQAAGNQQTTSKPLLRRQLTNCRRN